MFVDTAQVLVTAGKGGDGAVSFRHEIYVDKGGPDGGDGGKGGDVIFRATNDTNTLVDFRYQPSLIASNGENGSKRNKRGANGKPLYVKVPVGTIITRGHEVVADFIEDGQELVVARGGDGGFGNAHFKSSTRQTPKIAEKGEPGESYEAKLELKLLADVGLLGLPNAGKSTFLSVVSNAKPEIADYEFTTLSPNLGITKVDGSELLIADIPGLIEGAASGKGLGDEFLKHVERTAVLLHLIDIYNGDVVKNYQTIRAELEKYDAKMLKKPEIIALTKIEGLDDDIIEMQIKELQKITPKTQIFALSSSAHIGIDNVLRALKDKVLVARQKTVTKKTKQGIATITLDSKQLDQSWKVVQQGEVFVVTGKKIERFACKTNFDNYHGVNRLRDIMKKMGISYELSRRGAEGDSIIRVGDREFTFLEQ